MLSKPMVCWGGERLLMCNLLPHDMLGQFVRTFNRDVDSLETRLAQAQRFVCSLSEGKLLCKCKFGGKAPGPSEEEAKVEFHRFAWECTANKWK